MYDVLVRDTTILGTMSVHYFLRIETALCFRSTDVINPIIFHRLHSVNKVNTRLSLPYPLGSVVHLIFDSKCTSSLHQD